MKDITLIGKTLKPHGVKGWLRLSVNAPFEADLAKATVVFLKKGSHAVPYFVEQFDSHSLQILLEEVDSKEAAQKLSKLELYLRNEDILPIESRHQETEPLSYLSLVGYVIFSEGQSLGKIEEIVAFPQQEMAFIEYEGREIMVPLTDAYIKQIDSHKRTIQIELPEGFLDIF